MVEEKRRKGDHDGADKWLRIFVAIGEHGEPPTEARHSRPALYRRGDDLAPSLSFSAASRSISVSAESGNQDEPTGLTSPSRPTAFDLQSGADL